jgi:hypothetical protein
MFSMVRSACAVLIAVGAVVLAQPASAQFGSIFGNPPPRPPGDVPRGTPQYPPQYPAQQYPPYPDREPPPPDRGGFERRPVDRGQQGGYQSAPLPPPPGARGPSGPGPLDTRPQGPQDTQHGALPGLPQGQRQPRGTPQPANTAPQPGDEVVPEPPTQKIVNTSAVFSGLDKITGRIISFDVAINETVQFGALQVVPRACYTRPPTETPNTDAFIEVSEVTLQGEVKRIFSGWMFAASPGLHGVEHPIYDIWLTDCKGGQMPTVASSEPPPPAAPRPRASGQPQQRTQQPPRGQGGVPQLMPPPGQPPQRF